MPIIFVHGVASRKTAGHEDIWEKTIEPYLKEYIAPAISNDPENVLIQDAYWGNVSVPFHGETRVSLLDDERVRKLLQAKGSWIGRKLAAGEIGDNILPLALRKLLNLPGYFLGRLIDPLLRSPLNAGVTLFFGDIFFYLAERGTPEHPGNITQQLLEAVKNAHENKKARADEPLVIFSHSMGGQLVYDLVSYYLPKIAEMTGKENYKDICVDFWCAAASQVGLFKEMKVFKEDSQANNQSSKDEQDANIKFLKIDLGVGGWTEKEKQPIEKAKFPKDHLRIWWNLWDDSDYFSFTAEPLFEEVFDDIYDSGKSPFRAHTSHFDDEDFYKEFALILKEAKKVNWIRSDFLRSLKNLEEPS